MQDTLGIVKDRCDQHRRLNRRATIQKIIMTLLALGLIGQFIGAAALGATLVDMAQVLILTAILVLLWFYRSTEVETRENLARGLAGDLLMGMAMKIAAAAGSMPSSASHKIRGETCFIRPNVSFSPSKSGIMEVATRVVRERTEDEYYRRVTSGRMPRISFVPAEYRFTPEDVQTIMNCMIHDPDNIAVYKTVLDLIARAEANR